MINHNPTKHVRMKDISNRYDRTAMELLLLAVDRLRKAKFSAICAGTLAQALRRSCGDEETFDHFFTQPMKQSGWSGKISRLLMSEGFPPIAEESAADEGEAVWRVLYIDMETGVIEPSEAVSMASANEVVVAWNRQPSNRNVVCTCWPQWARLPRWSVGTVKLKLRPIITNEEAEDLSALLR